MLILFSTINDISHSHLPVLEIGVFCGRSLLGLATTFPNAGIIGVDPFYEDFSASPAYEDEAQYLSSASNNLSPTARIELLNQAIAELDNNFPDLNIAKRVSLNKITQDTFIQNHDFNNKFQLVHIDGEHTFKAVVDCLDSLDQILTENSWIIIDDILNPGFPDISEAVHTHPGHRKNFWPVVFGFNKGVYLFKPTNTTIIKEIQIYFLKNYSTPDYACRTLFDDSIKVERRKVIEKVTPNSNNLKRRMNHIFHRIIDKLF